MDGSRQNRAKLRSSVLKLLLLLSAFAVFFQIAILALPVKEFEAANCSWPTDPGTKSFKDWCRGYGWTNCAEIEAQVRLIDMKIESFNIRNSADQKRAMVVCDEPDTYNTTSAARQEAKCDPTKCYYRITTVSATETDPDTSYIDGKMLPIQDMMDYHDLIERSNKQAREAKRHTTTIIIISILILTVFIFLKVIIVICYWHKKEAITTDYALQRLSTTRSA